MLTFDVDNIDDAVDSLNTTQTVVDQHGTQHDLDVTWDLTSIDSTGDKTYTILGTIDLPEDFEEDTIQYAQDITLNYDSTITIITVDVYNDIVDIEVPYGTTSDEVLTLLPSTISLEDEDSELYTVDITWDMSNYSDTEGVYTLTGTLELVNDMVLEDGNTVSVDVTVQEQLNTITAINVEDTDFSDTVSYGTSLDDVIASLHDTVVIEDANGTQHTVTLTWTSSTYDELTADDYSFTGSFSLPDGVVNDPDTPLDLNIETTVTVMEPANHSTYDITNTTNDDEAYEGITKEITFDLITTDIQDQGYQDINLEITYDDTDLQLTYNDSSLESNGLLLENATLDADTTQEFTLTADLIDSGHHDLTITLINNDNDDVIMTKEMTLSVKSTNTVNYAYNMPEGTTVTLLGIVTEVHEDGFYLQPYEDRGMFVDYDNPDSNNITVGTKILLEADTNNSFSEWYLSNITTLDIISQDNPLPTPLDIDTTNLGDVFDQDGSLMNFSGLYFGQTIDYSSSLRVELKDNEGEYFHLYIDKDHEDYDMYETMFTSLMVDQMVDLTNVVFDQNVHLTDISHVDVTPLTQSELQTYIDSLYELDDTIYESFDTPNTQLIFDQTYTLEWESSNTNVIENNGTVHRPDVNESDEDVTITLTVSQDGSVKTTHTYNVTVPVYDPNNYELLYSTDFENIDTNFNDYSHGDIYDLDNPPVAWSGETSGQYWYTMDDGDQYNGSRSIRIRGNSSFGSYLALSNFPLSHLGKIEFDIGGYDLDGSKTGYSYMLVPVDEEDVVNGNYEKSDNIHPTPSEMTTVTLDVDYEDFDTIEEDQLVRLVILIHLTGDFDDYEESVINIDDIKIYRQPR